MLSNLFALLANVKAWVEALLAKFPAGGAALASLVAAAVTHFGFNLSVGKVEAIWAAVAIIVGSLTAHSRRAVALRAARK